MQRFKRRQLIVSEFQNKLTLLNVGYLFMLALTFGVVVLWPLVKASRDPDASELARASAARDLTATLSIMWPGVLAMVALYATHQVVLTHRLAGPLYRIRVTMVGMARGVFPAQIRLRKNDMLNEEAAVLNQLLSNLREHVSTVRNEQERMQTALEALDKRPEDSAAKAELRDAVSELRRELLRFDLCETPAPTAPSVDEPQAALPSRPAATESGLAAERNSVDSAS